MATKFRMYYIKQIVPDPPPPTIPVVLMPDGKYWTSVDLNIDDGLGEIYKYDSIYVNGYTFTDQYYYSYSAALRIAANIPGYHMPTSTEWNNLLTSINNDHDALRSTDGWYTPGTDTYGFNMLPLGNVNSAYTGTQSDIEMLGSRTCYWGNDGSDPVSGRHYCVLNWSWDISSYNEFSLPQYYFLYKVRLIKDN